MASAINLLSLKSSSTKEGISAKACKLTLEIWFEAKNNLSNAGYPINRENCKLVSHKLGFLTIVL